MAPVDSGPDFEVHALHLARAIHDPVGLQGPVMFEGREHDGVFVDATSIHAFEFTTRRDKQKAEKDGLKIARILKYLSSNAGNKYKSVTGWFVTAEEPTAEQRGAVDAISNRFGVAINSISIRTLRRQVCDAEGYLRCRDQAPFGSTSYGRQEGLPNASVDPEFSGSDGTAASVGEVAGLLSKGRRILLVGEFGAGKSFALRMLYRTLRKRYFKNAATEPFPVHINLRDCAGLRSPAEILRRHAEEIGFSGDRSLISAWRAGACLLLLDGFDEVIPTKWMGSASDLKQVRWQALEPVRRLVQEAPQDVGLIICGRSHYFTTQGEMIEALALQESGRVFEISDFTPSQRQQYLSELGATQAVPEWLPSRPLLLGYLAAMGDLAALAEDSGSRTQAEAWRALVSLICEREAQMFSAVRPATIRTILSRIATLARARGNELGPVGMDQMQQAFFDINGYYPDEEGIQLLLRLPGLSVQTEQTGPFEGRVFVDRALASTAYGEDLAAYIASPYNGHPLTRPAAWVSAGDDLSVEVAALAVAEMGLRDKAILAAADRRESDGQLDAVLADVIRVGDALGPGSTKKSYMIEGVLFEELAPSSTEPSLAGSHLRDCVVQSLDLTAVESEADCPTFESSLIGTLNGMAIIPDWLSSRFTDTSIDEYSDNARTTAALLQLPIPALEAVALTILKKVYYQRGSGRKEGALYRGLDQGARQLVPDAIQALVSAGWLKKTGSGDRTIYVPVNSKRRSALSALDTPNTFSLSKMTSST